MNESTTPGVIGTAGETVNQGCQSWVRRRRLGGFPARPGGRRNRDGVVILGAGDDVGGDGMSEAEGMAALSFEDCALALAWKAMVDGFDNFVVVDLEYDEQPMQVTVQKTGGELVTAQLSRLHDALATERAKVERLRLELACAEGRDGPWCDAGWRRVVCTGTAWHIQSDSRDRIAQVATSRGRTTVWAHGHGEQQCAGTLDGIEQAMRTLGMEDEITWLTARGGDDV